MSGFTYMCGCGGKYTDKSDNNTQWDRHEKTIKHQTWTKSIIEAHKIIKETEGNNNYTKHLDYTEDNLDTCPYDDEDTDPYEDGSENSYYENPFYEGSYYENSDSDNSDTEISFFEYDDWRTLLERSMEE